MPGLCRRLNRSNASKETSARAPGKEQEEAAPRCAKCAGRTVQAVGMLGIMAFACLSARLGLGVAEAAVVEEEPLTCPDMADCTGLSIYSQEPDAGGAHHHSPIVNGVHEGDRPDAIGILQRAYGGVFKTGNRNSASHLWSTYLLNQSSSKGAADLENLFTAFCGISASLVVPISAESRWRLTLAGARGGQHTGFMYYCTGCRGWPCLCDALEYLKVDTKTVTLADGSRKQYKFAVIGNPCATTDMRAKLMAPIDDPQYGGRKVTLQMSAPELTCDGSFLQGATLSDNGHIIIAMFFEDVPSLQAQDEEVFAEGCARRGERVGMGPIFRTLARVNAL